MHNHVALALLLTLFVLRVSADTTAITVLPFTAVDGEQRVWLGKGIADILTRNLAEFEQYRMVDRGRLQVYLREMELQGSAFTDPDEAVRVARVAKVSQVVIGSYRVESGRLEVSVAVVGLTDQAITQSLQGAGSLDNLHAVLADITIRLAQGQGIQADADTLTLISRRPSDSLSATEHFYRGMDAQDRGDYEAAVSDFIKASQADPKYREAQLWIGRMFEFLNLDALAISAYDRVLRRYPDATVGLDAGLFAAKLASRSEPAAAIQRLRPLIERTPATAHTVEAAFLLAEANRSAGAHRAAYEAYATVLALHDRFDDARQRRRRRQSRFFPWDDVLGRYREASIRMVEIWRSLDRDFEHGPALEPPRGAILVTPDTPMFDEKKYGHLQPLFENERPLPNWAERFYAVIAPPGYVITGIDLKVRGQLVQSDPQHSFTMRISPFPIPRNYHNSWLGVIYGQTRKPRQLSKHIPFYGRDQGLLALQFIENHGRIFDWGISLRLRSHRGAEPATTVTRDTRRNFDEGALLGRIELNEPAFSGVAKPLSVHWYEARQTLALADRRNEGLHLVFVKGDLESGQADLWESRSADGRHWDTPRRLALSSLSDDFSPRLVRAEDGRLRAFWISNRRGLGWELWTSVRDPDSDRWAAAARIPLEMFGANRKKAGHYATQLLHYAATQDHRGRWVLALRARAAEAILVFLSDDGEQWRQAGAIEATFDIVNPAIVQDAGGRYRLTAFATTHKLHLWSSNDLKTWHEASFTVNRYADVSEVAPHPIHLLPHTNGELTALVSDTKIGLQYARFNPDARAPDFDLVRGVGLEDYAASTFGDRYVVARRRNDAIEFRRYERFQSHPEGRKPSPGIIYTEHSPGVAGNEWRRIFARWRVIQPDVTTVGVGSDERVWWGIETGAMTLKDEDFFAVDVAEGFFHHHVTTIAPCGDTTGFASRDLKQPRIGIARRGDGAYKFSRRDLPKTKGHVAALICSGRDRYVAGTSGGQVVLIEGPMVSIAHHFVGEAVTALAPAAADGEFLIGTSTGRLAHFDGELHELNMAGVGKGSITAIAVDGAGAIWFGIAGGGVYTGTSGKWRTAMADFEPGYRSVSHIAPDPVKGVWMIAAADETSRGVLYSDGDRHRLLRPVDNELRAPTGLAVAPSGTVWIGTAFDGLFAMTPP